MPMKNKRKKNSREKIETIAKAVIAEADFPLASIPGVSHMEISSNNKAIISGCEGVLEYDDSRIRLNLGTRAALFRGTDLVMKTFNSDEVIIEGIFAAIEFS